MQTKSDVQLLREYAWDGCDEAFTEIVQRHTDLLYSSALRQVAADDLACDIVQAVFADLARKAPKLVQRLTERETLTGWLYQSTRYAALALLRQERRRQIRERKAVQESESNTEPDLDWHGVESVLDQAMASLKHEERDALLLRFFKNQDLRSVGEALGISADAAQKRITRALEKIRSHLLHRGIRTTAEALSSALSLNAVQPAPAELVTMLMPKSLLSAATKGGFTLSSSPSWLPGALLCGLVATMLVVIPLWIRQRADMARREAVTRADRDLAGLTLALEALEVDNGFFPKSATGLKALLNRPPEARVWMGPYIMTIPQDPWGHAYIYVSPGQHRPNYFDLSSMGPDGHAGTEDDITNWRPGYPAPIQ
jgi:type II secretion system protein G